MTFFLRMLFLGALSAFGVASAGQPSAQTLPFASAERAQLSPGRGDDGGEIGIDDGSYETVVSLPDGGEFIWMNVLSPPPDLCRYRVASVRVLWPEDDDVSVGNTADLYVYADADGDGSPATGTELLAALEDVPVQAVDGVTFSEYEMPGLVDVSGCADLVVAVVNSGIGTEASPATLDETAPQGRSWVGIYEEPITSPPTLPAPIFGPIGDLSLTDGNFLVRAVVTPQGTSVEGESVEVGFILSPAYPNPARRMASVRFRLEAPERVRLSLFDAAGRRVYGPVEAEHGAGTHVRSIPTDGLAPGLYVWRLDGEAASASGGVVVAQ